MRARLGMLALCAAVLLVPGCGTGDLVLNVDILSFTRELQDPFVFPPVPAVPGGFATGEQALVDDQQINLVEGLADAASIREVSLRFQSIALATTGTGVDTLRVYLSDANTSPLTTEPVLVQVLQFFPGVSDTATSVLTADTRVNGLFNNSSLRVSVTTSFRGPSVGPALAGSLTVSALDATVIAERKKD